MQVITFKLPTGNWSDCITIARIHGGYSFSSTSSSPLAPTMYWDLFYIYFWGYAGIFFNISFADTLRNTEETGTFPFFFKTLYHRSYVTIAFMHMAALFSKTFKNLVKYFGCPGRDVWLWHTVRLNFEFI